MDGNMVPQTINIKTSLAIACFFTIFPILVFATRRVGGYWIRVRLSVCLVCPSNVQVGFYSATELQNYWADSNQTFYNERSYIGVVHLGIGFVVRPELGSYDLVKHEGYQHILKFAIPRPYYYYYYYFYHYHYYYCYTNSGCHLQIFSLAASSGRNIPRSKPSNTI